jgi:hypothetical protein
LKLCVIGLAGADEAARLWPNSGHRKKPNARSIR